MAKRVAKKATKKPGAKAKRSKAHKNVKAAAKHVVRHTDAFQLPQAFLDATAKIKRIFNQPIHLDKLFQ